MNILILVNSGPGFPTYFWRLGTLLRQRGHRVCFAADSPFVAYEEPSYGTDKQVTIFSNSFREDAFDPEQLALFGNENTWELFFSDFDRFQAYGINLDKSMHWYASLANHLTGFFSRIIRRKNIDVILYESISNSFSAFAYEVAQHAGVRFLGLSSSRLPSRFELHTSPDGIRSDLEQTYSELEDGARLIPATISSAVEAYINGFNSAVPDYMSTSSLPVIDLRKKYGSTSKIKQLFQKISFVAKTAKSNYPYVLGNPLLFSANQFKRSLIRYVRSKSISGFFSTPDADDEYYLYPLHFHPEASTSIYARHYVDEACTIKNISFNLPFGRYLYVKDHVAAFAVPTRDFYRCISNLPNVKLILPHENTKDLIRKSKAVITLTSTVGYEAIVLGKPVFVFGDVFYDFHPLSRKVTSWSDLNAHLMAPPTVYDSARAARNLATAYFMCSHPGKLDYSSIPSDEVVSAVSAALEQGRVLSSS